MTLNLRVWLGDLELTDYPFALRYGMDLGQPENVYAVMESLLSDGEVISSNRTSNRSLVVPILVEGADMQDLADNEAALIAECEKAQNTLKVDPGDGYGPATVFRTFRVQARLERDDDAEIALLRSYSLEIQALPAARSVDSVTVGAEFVADSVVISDDCEATTGWSATAPASSNNPVAVAVDSSIFATGTGSLKFTPAGTVAPDVSRTANSRVHVTRTGLSINASGGGYFVVRVRGEWELNLQDFVVKAYLTTSGGGRQSVSPLVGTADSNGFQRLSFPVPNASTITAFEMDVFQSLSTYGGSLAAPKFWIDSLGLAANSSAPQNVMSFDVVGSMRCEGSFQVSAPAGLGDVLLYTAPDLGDGFRPDLRRWQTAGAATADSAAINGTYMSPGTGTIPVLTAPASMFRSGSYAVLARMRRSAAGSCTITVTAQTKSGSTAIGSTEAVTSPTITLADASYRVMRLGVIELPPLVTDPASNATVTFTITQTGIDYYIDELLVLPLEDHALTWVACGSGAASATVANRLWIDEPSPVLPRGARLVGTSASRLDARYVLPESTGRHVLKPGRMLAYLMTSAAGGADLQVVYYPAWHSNAGQ